MFHLHKQGNCTSLLKSKATILPPPIHQLRLSKKAIQGLCALLLTGVTCMPTYADGLKVKINQKGQVGYVNTDGTEVIKCQYQSGTAFHNGVAKVGKAGFFGLINEEGKQVLPISYTEIESWRGSDLIRLRQGNKYGLADSKGTILVDVKYSSISNLNCYGRAWISSGGKSTKDTKGNFVYYKAKWGVVDSTGRILIAPTRYGLYEFSFNATNIQPMHEGWRLSYPSHYATDTLVTDAKYMGFKKKAIDIWYSGILDSVGNIVVPEGLYKCVMKPTSGMSRYYKEEKKKTTWGYYDLDKQQGFDTGSYEDEFTNLTFWSHSDFTGDIACVNGSSWSVIDKSGNTIKTGFSKLKYGSTCGKWALWGNNDQCEIIDMDGKSVDALQGYTDINFRYDTQEPELYSVCKDKKWGVVDSEGHETIPFMYDAALGVRNGTIITKAGDNWGMMKANGDTIVPNQFANIVFSNCSDPEYVWVVKSDSLYYNFNIAQQTVSAQGYKNVENFTYGLAWVRPADITVANDEINRAQADLTTEPTAKEKEQFGYILRNDNEVVFSKPLCHKYSGSVKKLIRKKDNAAMSESQMKKVLLMLTASKRDYPMGSIIEEESWDY